MCLLGRVPIVSCHLVILHSKQDALALDDILNSELPLQKQAQFVHFDTDHTYNNKIHFIYVFSFTYDSIKILKNEPAEN